MRKRIWIPAVILLTSFIIIAAGAFTYPWRNINTDFVFRLFALSESYQLTNAEKETALTIVKETLRNPEQATSSSEIPDNIPEILTEKDSREVWVSLYMGRQPRAMAMATEETVYRSLQAATQKAFDSVKKKAAWKNAAEKAAIQIDILQDRSGLLSTRDAYTFFAIEPGVDGLILTRGKRVGYQLPSDALTRGILTPRKNSRNKCVKALMGRACLDLGLRRKAWREDPEIELERFRTVSFGEPVPGKGMKTFYRGNSLVDAEEVTAKRIYRSIQEAGHWLLANARTDGKFNYQYYPNKDLYPRGYNAVRHAGTMFGLLELYRFFQDPAFVKAAEKAAPYLYENIKQPGKEKDLLAVPSGRAYPTGAAALSLLAFINMPPEMRPPDYQRYLEGLGRFLLLVIDERGAVFEGYLAYHGAKLVVKEPLYYPGEAMLALGKLYEQSKDKRWLEGAKHIAKYQIAKFNRGAHAGHWVIQGLGQLYLMTKNEEYGKACLAMANSFIDSQCPPNTPPFPDYFGAWRRDTETPRTTRAGSRSESMTYAMRTALAMGYDATPYENSLLYAAKHQIEQQFRPENSYYLPRPDRAIGGYRAGLVDNHLRIDFNQHSAVGMIGALEAAVRREKTEKWWNELPLYPPDQVPAAQPKPEASPTPTPSND